MIKTSVILATYNRIGTLSRAIDSVLAQTLKDFELIIVDDGSADSTPELLRNYAQKDNRIKVITQANQGLPTARNTGVEAAAGKYIAWIDSDDAYSVNHLIFHFNFLEKHTEYSACILEDINSISDYYPKVSFQGEERHSLYYGSPFVNKQLLGSLGPHSFMTRDSFTNLGGYRKEQTIIEDLDFTLRYSENVKWARIHSKGSYFYTYPEDNPGQSLININVPRFLKRHVACYVSGWCRINKIQDPVAHGSSLEEIMTIAKSIPLKDRVTIYRSMRYFIPMLSSVNKMSEREADDYILGMFSDYKFIKNIMYKKFKNFIKKHNS